MTDTAERTWKGAAALVPFLVPIADLEDFPGNARLGDVTVLAESLERFGQLKPVVSDGTRTVSGHHIRRAAASLGWTHVAVIDHSFADEAEQLAFNVADNRTADLGTYDQQLLLAQLETLLEADALYGTGFSNEDVAAFEQQMAELGALHEQQAEPPPFFPQLDPDTLETSFRCPSCAYEWSGSPRPGEE